MSSLKFKSPINTTISVVNGNNESIYTVMLRVTTDYSNKTYKLIHGNSKMNRVYFCENPYGKHINIYHDGIAHLLRSEQITVIEDFIQRNNITESDIKCDTDDIVRFILQKEDMMLEQEEIEWKETRYFGSDRGEFICVNYNDDVLAAIFLN